MRKPSKIEMTDEQRATLTVWLSAGKTEQRLAKRAQVVLRAADGVSLKDIAAKVGLGFQSCLKWRKRFAFFAGGWAHFAVDGKGHVMEMHLDVPNYDFWFDELEFKRKP